jgi:dimethylhistidine N-methyltransferase
LLGARESDVVRHLPSLSTLVELGPGSGEKLAMIVRAAAPTASPTASLTVHLVDVSSAALDLATRTLGAYDVTVVPHRASYEAGLDTLSRGQAGRTLVLFLGSNIGNFDPPGADEFLRTIRRALVPGDALLIGADLLKAERDLLLAYDDPLGVTAAFNRNLLVRINRELDGAVDLDAFAHHVIWNEAESRVEMHLVSLRRQRVSVPAAHVDFMMDEGETIWTESSHKYNPDELHTMARKAGFVCMQQWVDTEWPFAESLFFVEAP